MKRQTAVFSVDQLTGCVVTIMADAPHHFNQVRHICCTCQAPAEERGALQDGASHGSEPLEADQRGGQADVALRGGSGRSGQTADHAGGPFSGLGHGGLSCH